MIPYDISCLILLLDEGGICCDLSPDTEECRLHIVFLQDIEYQRCVIGIGTIIKGERDLARQVA